MNNQIIKEVQHIGNKKTKAQYSMELITIMTVGVFLILPILYMFYYYSQSSVESVSSDIVLMIGNEIVNNAEMVQYFGDPSKVSFEVGMPDGIDEIAINRHNDTVYEILFIRKTNDNENRSVYAFTSSVPLNGSFGEASISAGKKTIVCQSLKNADDFKYVNVSIY
ncbi:hypothetical protein K9M79_00495 [Candidatus Woesearchaeota archaeon]|nr:hypothetical protein [Candidatus Woesearchaeota archaeon]